MTAIKTNERPGTRAQVKNVRMSATKARVVLDLVRGKSVAEAIDVLTYTERAAAEVIGKCLDSAVANAAHNDQIDPETLFVSACYADEGRTLYRWRPRARGRATRIRKRTCHITMIVSPMPAGMLAREQAKREAIPGSRAARRRGQEAASRRDRVAKSQATGVADHDESELTESLEDQGIVDTDVEATERAAEIVDQLMAEDDAADTEVADTEVADEVDAVDATADIAEDTEEVADPTDDIEEGTEATPERSASGADDETTDSGSVPTGTSEERSDEGSAS